MSAHQTSQGVILAGGTSSRLGGGDKTLRRLGNRPILSHIVERLGPQCAGMVLSANGDPARFADFRLAVVPDHPEDRDAGPLAGLLAGLDWIAARHPPASFVLTVPSDTPFLPRDLGARLAQALDENASATVALARSDGRSHPLAALWPVSIRHDLRQALRIDGERRVGAFLDRHRLAWAEWPTEPYDPFLNVNTPQDLEAAWHTSLDGSSS